MPVQLKFITPFDGVAYAKLKGKKGRDDKTQEIATVESPTHAETGSHDALSIGTSASRTSDLVVEAPPMEPLGPVNHEAHSGCSETLQGTQENPPSNFEVNHVVDIADGHPGSIGKACDLNLTSDSVPSQTLSTSPEIISGPSLAASDIHGGKTFLQEKEPSLDVQMDDAMQCEWGVSDIHGQEFKNGKMYYLVEWNHTWEPAENISHLLDVVERWNAKVKT
ncbi:hypothetical protein J7T55_007548, partial [Diaporthe amygdali]|uniref:uncharacterized protein n=1 Tax=Phomopsis amygdali TaxID=1214568 RepID=UPI0022FDFE96